MCVCVCVCASCLQSNFDDMNKFIAQGTVTVSDSVQEYHRNTVAYFMG